MCFLKDLFKKKTEFPVIEQAKGELPSPRVAIDSQKIIYDEATETLTITGIKGPVRITSVANTNSMEPAIDAGHTTVCSSNPNYMSTDMIKRGDVIIYNASWTQSQIIHAVIETGEDVNGWYCKAQGWHNDYPDPEIIRIGQILQVVLITVWSGMEDEA